MTEQLQDEDARVTGLLDAQAKAAELFTAVESRGIVAPGVLESAASDAIRDLAHELFGTDKWWHKRIVRAGPNTLEVYKENPPDREIGADDIAFADFGRTYVLGDDPVKARLRDALPVLFDAGRHYFEKHPDVTGAELYAFMVAESARAGWEFGGSIAGHLVGEFPHEKMDGGRVQSNIAPGSTRPMRGLDKAGRRAHWILEVHLVDRERRIGGFYEELLDIGH